MEPMKENKKRQDAEEIGAAKADKIKFTNWFSTKIRGHKHLRAHHYDSVWAFFKNKGLSQHETSEKYDSMLQVYGF